MDNYTLRLNHIIDTYSPMFLNNPNIMGIGIGYKKINGIKSNKLSLMIFVKEKYPKDMLMSKSLIPKKFNGIITDVIGCGEPRLLAKEVRPAYGGLSIGISVGGGYRSGTLGYAVTDKYSRNQIYFLTCNHCVSAYGLAGNGIEVYQPSLEFGGKREDSIIGEISRSIPLKYTSEDFPKNPAEYNEVDAAIVAVHKPLPKNLLKYEINDELRKISKAKLLSELAGNIILLGTTTFNEETPSGIQVKAEGSVSNTLSGKLLSSKSFFRVRRPYVDKQNLIYTFKEQIICEMSPEEGDSGAIGYVDEGKKAFGLLMAGNRLKNKSTKAITNIGVFNPINKVLDLLKVELITPMTFGTNLLQRREF